MFCMQCGAEGAAAAKFCGKCGEAMPALAGAQGQRADPIFASNARPAPAQARETEPSENEFYELAVGDRGRDYYRPRFEAFESGAGPITWNWAGCFLTFYWMLYRKLWGSAAVYFVASYAVSMMMAVAIGLAPNAAVLILIAALAIQFVVPALFVNRLYYVRCRRLIERAKKLSPEERVQKAWLASKGGTSAVAAVILGLFVVIAVVGMLAAIALPAHYVFTVRARVAEAHFYGSHVAQSITEKYVLTGRFPDNLSEVQLPDDKPAAVRGLQLDPKNGALQIQLDKLPAGKDMFELVPTLDDMKRLVWTCRGVTIPDRQLPGICRQSK